MGPTVVVVGATVVVVVVVGATVVVVVGATVVVVVVGATVVVVVVGATVVVVVHITFTVDVEGAQPDPPCEMVQTNELIPGVSPVTVVPGFVALLNVPLPLETVHNPEPTTGVFAAKVTVDEHGTFWEVPASETVNGEREMVTSDVEGVQVVPIDVHRKVFAPNPRPVTEEVGELGEAMVPDPDTRVHVPVLATNKLVPVLNVPPVVSVFPAKVVVEAHPTLVLVPALAVVGQEPHPLGQGSHKSPTRSTSASSWFALASVGQLSFRSQTVSPS